MPRPLIPERRRRILDAAEELVLRDGFDQMSVQTIADRVGIAKGSVYREFDSKAAVLEALLDRSMERMTAAAVERLGPEDPPRLSHAYAVGAEVLVDDPLMTAAFLDDRGVLGSYVDTVTDDRYRQRHRDVVTWIRDLQRHGSLDTSVDAEGLGLALSSTTLGLLDAARRLGPLDRGQLRAAIAAMADLLDGLEPR